MQEYHAYFFTATIKEWKHLLKPDKYKEIIVDSLRFLVAEKRVRVCGFVIMPNHIHFFVGIQPKADGTMQASSPTNISQVVRIFKGRVAHRAGHSVFQRSFYDHIIRTENDYWAIVQ